MPSPSVPLQILSNISTRRKNERKSASNERRVKKRVRMNENATAKYNY